ncbi:MAG: serine/threonine protein kinase [Lentisphaeria bacterium]|nr:serine/threonine protein kinase [Lentisphaeria bacterium]
MDLPRGSRTAGAAAFDRITPEFFLPALEDALACRLTGLASALPSYINRVYEIEAATGERLVVKFYRPGRWTREAILEEHEFLWDCDGEEIPVVPPYELETNSTLGELDGVFFAIFPRMRGREIELEQDETLERVGSLLGRIHACGERRDAPHRLRMTPASFAEAAMHRIFDRGAVDPSCEQELIDLCDAILDLAEAVYPPGDAMIRIHGDFHRANVLDRPGIGLMAIDFDDMVTGPPVQDLWLLLPGTLSESKRELDVILAAYEVFRPFDRASLRLVEPLRAMRMMHFLSWCAVQSGDAGFRRQYPDWGTREFWRRETADFRIQLENIRRALDGKDYSWTR